MKKNFLNIIAYIASIGMIFSSCQDEDIKQTKETNTFDYSISDTSSCSDNLIFKIPINNSISKGYRIDYQNDFIESGVAFFGEKPQKTFQTMKVYRQSDPTKYFYIMLTNLDIPYPFDFYLKDSTNVVTTGCSPYADEYSNVKEYGLLYNQYAAEHIRNYIFMKLPIIRNGVPLVKNGKTITKSVKGRFMNRTDLADLLECRFEELHKYGGHGVTEYIDSDELYETKFAYYNAFVFGLDITNTETSANHSLGGYKDIYNVDYPADRDSIRASGLDYPDYILKQIYTKDYRDMTHSGYYWMAPEEWQPRTLQVYRNSGWSENADWIAIWISGYGKYRYSVRLVFDPFDK